MSPDRAQASLFLRLLPNLGKSGTGRRTNGHEDYLTQVVAAVLDEDPGLVTRLLASWCGETGTAPLQVHAERTYPAPAGRQVGEVRVDLVCESAEALVFIENKLGSPLNRYAAVDGAPDTVADQVEVYHEVLETARGTRRGHLLVLCRDPQPDHADLPHFRGSYYWWDLFRVVEARLGETDHPAGHAAWLQQQLIGFFREVCLDPPAPLAPGEQYEAEQALRLLADAARRAGGLGKPRMTDSLLYELAGATRTVGFQRDRLTVYESGRGARVAPALGEAFWDGGVDHQVDVLACLLPRVGELPPAPTSRLTLEAALDRFEPACREVAAFIVGRVSERWRCTPSIGRQRSGVAEIALHCRGGPTVRVAPYTLNVLVLVTTGRAARLRAAVEDMLECPLGTCPRQYVVNVPLRLLSPDKIEPLVQLLEQHEHEEPRP